VILAIDGAPTRTLSYEQALGRMLGEVGSVVDLDVLRGTRSLDFRLVRRQFRTASVHSRLLAAGGDRIGYVGLSSFTTGATQAVARAVARLEAGHARALVLDLRGNPGGLFEQAVGIASLFLDHGVITSTEGAHQPVRVYRADPGQTTRLPLVVLIDRASASAAEIVASALRDNERASLVGQRTFGKGLVQSIEPLAAGAAIKLTVAKYLTPMGMDLSQRGVRPDVLAPDDPSTPADEGLTTAIRVITHSLV
jgi:carboxyl-terminal processing protease